MAVLNMENIPGGTKRVIQLDLFSSLGVNITVPIFVVKGNSAHPLMLAVAGVHGDEFEGPEAIRRTFDTLDPARLNGTFVGIPVCNILAYESQTRESPDFADGLNLARVFPGDEHGSYTRRLAYHLYELATTLLERDRDVFLDLHSGGTRYEYVQMIGYHRNGKRVEESRKLSTQFGIPRMWEIPDNPGTFNWVLSQYGIATVAGEVTGRGGATEEDVNAYFRGILNVLRACGISPSDGIEVPNPIPQTTYATHYVNFSENGHFRPAVGLGDEIRRGQVLGTVVNMIGEVQETLLAPRDGHVWARREFCTVRSGDIAFMMAEETCE